MAVSWSFALLLVLTLVALITFSQPLFQSTPASSERHTNADLKNVPQATIARGVPQRNPPNSKASDVEYFTDGAWSLTMLRGGSQRQRRTRKLIQRDVLSPCGEQQRRVVCRAKRKTTLSAATRPNPDADRPPRTRASDHPPPAKSGIPRRSTSAHFESDRMVPTGPNPLHNSNRSQVIFP
ncbi:uncharacterized protein [Physcomitrium patens]|uniref:Uncharacterized protein n=1 Tax=Physcomitrium patens TaxID=3218 RepID=A0A2K1KBA7_PHYPA|nr:uncharacterized protein LOC112284975 [Physcomitrium patens]PNR51060.1 hypothetical protein PHYPA_010246 [Physcomitrium patens]|eukprot:XP_024381169.1 uncharacterized protein LOC112284975 [Physcomitrella patens]